MCNKKVNKKVKSSLNINTDHNFNPKLDIHFNLRINILSNHQSWMQFYLTKDADEYLYPYLN